MTGPNTYHPPPRTARRARGRGWSVLAAVLLITGLVLAPLSIVAAHSKSLSTDTNTFAATFAPLSSDPVVQSLVIDAVIDALDENLDFSGVTTHLLEGLDLSDGARHALGVLERRALEEAQAKVSSLVEQVVLSDRFAAVWEQTLRGTHTQLLATLRNDPDATLTVGNTGVIELQLGPIIAEIRQRLVDQDITLAQAVPDIQLGLPLTKKESLGSIHTIYSVVTTLGTWLPWLTAALLAAGLLSARRRRTATITTAFALVFTTAVLGALIFVGRHASAHSLGQGTLPKPAVLAIYNVAVESLGRTTLIIGVLALLVAVLLLLTRPSTKRRSA